MRISRFGRYALSGCVVAAMLGGCGGSQPPIGASSAGPTTRQTHSGVTYEVLYNFEGPPEDGGNPRASLISVNGTLYSTTQGGGRKNHGTVFTITTAGAEAVLHSFGGPKDGSTPYARLINVNGTLYGTTTHGGAHHLGTVFAITTSGSETVLHSFKGYPHDGAAPVPGLLNVNGTLFGTTFYGGRNKCYGKGCGTVFSITVSGKETVLHSFAGSDGKFPAADLIDVKGKLYSTTDYGGANCIPSGGCGTVFSITRSGREVVLHSFGDGAGDGQYPYAGLIYVKGVLYGSTTNGGAKDYGMVFSIKLSGKETVLHSFGGGSEDGRGPEGDLANMNGTAFGTTWAGGEYNWGTVFSVTTGGSESLLYNFKGGSADGEDPVGGLVNLNGTLYGTTAIGGVHDEGTVFELMP
jgi:uncharacterized repeat protein (TIGR03803 family)